MFRRIMDNLSYVQTWVWVWGIVSTSSVAVVIWAFITRRPGVVVFVLGPGDYALMLIALETALIVHDKINERPCVGFTPRHQRAWNRSLRQREGLRKTM